MPGAPSGRYTLEVVPPTGYLPQFPSGMIPPEPSPLDPAGASSPLVVLPSNGPPQDGEPTTWYVDFDLEIGDPDVVNNHVPLDPILSGSVIVRKTSAKLDVVRGELVPYRITITNTLAAPIPNVDLLDMVPPGFKYVAGSARVDGVAIEPEVDGRQLLRRLDPDRYYQVYGDDGTLVEDTPTQGKFYVRIERGDDHVMWGNFKVELTDTDLAQIDRVLYGAKLRFRSDDRTPRGDSRTQVDVYAAEPETASAREEFRGTGGSLYYLRNYDITIGSERVRIEVRDRDSGLVLETRELRPFEDYDMNYVQGRVMMNAPVPTTAPDGYLAREATLAGNPVYVVVRYEYRPGANILDQSSFGGRASHAVTDWLDVGVTGSRDEQLGGEHDLYGADVMVNLSDRSYLKAEVARTEGTGFGEQSSVDGGFLFRGVPGAADPAARADAWRAEGNLDLADVLREDWDGSVAVYVQQRDRGFSAPGQLTSADTDQWGTSFESEVLGDDTVLLQVGGTVAQAGTLDVRGGRGASTVIGGFFNCDTSSGDGAPGSLRLEVPQQNPQVSLIGTTVPAATAADVGTLRDRDRIVVQLSRDRALASISNATEMLHYELDVAVGGVPQTYTDDPAAFRPANQPGQPVRIRFQAYDVNNATRGPWRDLVTNRIPGLAGIAGDRPTHYRFQLIFDRSVTADAVVEELRVLVR